MVKRMAFMALMRALLSIHPPIFDISAFQIPAPSLVEFDVIFPQL
jgi:hypothetical protein